MERTYEVWHAQFVAYVKTRYRLDEEVIWGHNERKAMQAFQDGQTYEQYGDSVVEYHMRCYHPNRWRQVMESYR